MDREKITIQFQLNQQFQQNLTVYINYRNHSLADRFFKTEQMITSLMNKVLIYSIELELIKNYEYEYFYSKKADYPLRNEVHHRLFKYDSSIQYKPDEWDKTWVLYRVSYKQQNFLQECQIEIQGDGQNIPLLPIDSTLHLEGSEQILITNVEQYRCLSITHKNQKIQEFGKKFDIVNCKRWKMNSIYIKPRTIFLNKEENDLTQIIQENLGLLQTDVDPLKEKKKKFNQQMISKDEQIVFLQTRVQELYRNLQTAEEQNNQLKQQIINTEKSQEILERNREKEQQIQSVNQNYANDQNLLRSQIDEIANQINLQEFPDFGEIQETIFDQLPKVDQVKFMENQSNYENKRKEIIGYKNQIDYVKNQAMDVEEQTQKLSEIVENLRQLEIETKALFTEIQGPLLQQSFIDCKEEKDQLFQKIEKFKQEQSESILEKESLYQKLGKIGKENKELKKRHQDQIEKIMHAYESVHKELEEQEQNIFGPFFENQVNYQQQLSLRYKNIAQQQIQQQLYEIKTATNKATYLGLQLSEGYNLFIEELQPLQQAILNLINQINDSMSFSNLYQLLRNVSQFSNIIDRIENIGIYDADEAVNEKDCDLIESLKKQRQYLDNGKSALEKLKEVLQLEENLSLSIQSKQQIITQIYIQLSQEIHLKLNEVIQEVKNKK